MGSAGAGPSATARIVGVAASGDGGDQAEGSSSSSSKKKGKGKEKEKEKEKDKEKGTQQQQTKKKPQNTGVWPCKINGCNKQFAREADLKRHQRTTKTHSMPGFQCPQCEANFTRTDALRRHQKSRHDGVVIEPDGDKGEGDEEGRSRSGTPSSSKGKEKATTLPVTTHQGAPTHTAHIPAKPPNPLQPPPWVNYPTSWQDSNLQPNMGPIGYVPVQQPQAMYYPSRHYRPHTSTYSTTSTATSRTSSSQPPQSANSAPEPALDPNLDEERAEITEEEMVAVVQAMLRQAESEKQREREMREAQSYGSSSLQRPEPMEHILTEDGEPMLNPAELLTSESLASPPPS
ncbi:hypothetical protein CPC08DRAFT_517163 [Agrocybe pediades]|nr:hypothetical protein CPC08DRAFT_517163 [Agrocybe pediades]